MWAQGVVIPPALRQKVMRILFASDDITNWLEQFELLPLLGPLDLNEPHPESGLTLLHRAVEKYVTCRSRVVSCHVSCP